VGVKTIKQQIKFFGLMDAMKFSLQPLDGRKRPKYAPKEARILAWHRDGVTIEATFQVKHRSLTPQFARVFLDGRLRGTQEIAWLPTQLNPGDTLTIQQRLTLAFD
jgi:hypothetical protein